MMKEWTVMIYLAGNNNLSEECIWAIKEMYRVGLKGDIAVVAQYQSRARGVPVIRYDIRKAARGEVVNDPKRSKKGSQDSRQSVFISGDDSDGGLHQYAEQRDIKKFVSARELKNFILDCVKLYPAKRYLVILSGHGSGAVGDAFLKEDGENNAKGYLSIPRFRWALEEVNKVLASNKDLVREGSRNRIDVLGLDACAMSMAEVGYELKDVADYMVGAEGFEMNTGWPYHRILETLSTNPDMSPEVLATTIVEKYVAYYSDYAVAGVSVDQAACDLSGSGRVAGAVKRLVTVLKEEAAANKSETESGRKKNALMDAIILAHWRSQSYKYEDYVDLWDFCHLLYEGYDNEAVRAACREVKEAIGHDTVSEGEVKDGKGEETVNGCVLKSGISGATYQHSHGLSIYFPWAEMTRKYGNLRFCEVTGWDKFITNYIKETRREYRKVCGIPQPISAMGDSGEEIRFGAPYDKFGAPYDKGGNLIIPKVKNPPDGFFSQECLFGPNPSEAEEEARTAKTKK